METKVCSKCNEEKPLSMFGVYRHRNNSPKGSCKSCEATIMRKRYSDNEEHRNKVKSRETEKYWEKRNVELVELTKKVGKLKTCSICGYEGSVENFKRSTSKKTMNKLNLIGTCKKCYNTKQKEYKKENPDMFKEAYRKTYARRKKDADFMNLKKEHDKQYNSRPEVKEKRNKLFFQRRKDNGTYHTRRLLTNTLLQTKQTRKPNQRTKDILGYTPSELFSYIGEKPEGRYDLDHLIPLSWFEPTTKPFLTCDLRNLEWKEHTKNVSKNNYYADEVSLDYFNTIKQYIKSEYLDRFVIENGMVIDKYKNKVLDLWKENKSISELFVSL